ncbi:MAG: Thiamine-phosphate synthase [Methanomassiliicoccales archaeon PtaU1.Bin030]|nr:MAG: Thiamine-phosphate synthase [Methanomassiliicoccales archaeon PtaU1.Bin030]
MISKMELYIVTDRKASRGRDHMSMVRAALDGGADVIQLRDKDLSGRDLYALAREMASLVHASRARFIVNDRLDIALAAGADGVHLGQYDLPVAAARSLSPPSFIIGVSVGSVEEALAAERDGADYVALSPVFSTPTKDDAGPGHGLEVLREIKAAVKLPVIAIGGVNAGNVTEVVAAGADGVAVISAVLGADDVEAAARSMRELVIRAKASRAGA